MKAPTDTEGFEKNAILLREDNEEESLDPLTTVHKELRARRRHIARKCQE